MSRYDEDLSENPFFFVFEKQCTTLFDEATANRWIICIPRFSAVQENSLTERDFQDQILKPLKEDIYQTITGCEVEISGGQISLLKGFPENKQVKILFEETFYNSKDESYRVLCVSAFFNKTLESNESSVDEENLTKPPSSYDDYCNILWRNAGSSKTKEHFDKVLTGFCLHYQKLQGGSIEILAELVSGQLTQAMQTVLKDQNIRRFVQKDEGYMANLKVAVEMYMMNAVHKHLFSAVQLFTKSADSTINKKTRNLVDIRLHQLGVRKEFEENLPGAKKELAILNQYSTPMGRMLCLKRVFGAISKPLKGNSGDMVMTTDDLLPLLIYLIIKSQIPNWSTNLMYMKHFQQLAVMDKDEISFYLATVEAALDYISSDELRVDSRQFSPQKVSRPANSHDMKRQLSGGSTTTKEKFFQYVQYGDESAVRLMLKKRSDQGEEGLSSKLCHPLCDCVKCTDILNQNKLNSNKFSINARDDMGRIALHIAAFYGQANLIDILSKSGSLVDASDFMGYTPLHLACQKGYQNIILLLVHFGSDISTRDNEGNTPLHLCAKNGHEDCVKAILFLDILKNKLNVNAQNDMKDTPLHLAAKWGYEGIVRFLLESEANPQTRNRKKQTPLDVAQNPSIKQQLQTACEEALPVSVPFPGPLAPPATSPTNPTSVHASHITKRRPSRSKPDVPSTSPTDKLSKDYVVIDSDQSIKTSVPLLDNTSKAMMSLTTTSVTNLDTVYLGQIEKLYKAIANKDLPLVKFYLGWSELEDYDEEESPMLQENTALCHPLCQCSKCHPKQKASSTSLSVNCQNKKGFAPLHISVIEKNMDAFRLFLRRGANVSLTTLKKVTAMHLACFYSNLEMTKMLLKCGADVNAVDSYGEIPLHLASSKKNRELVQFLIQSSSHINKSNVVGNTPLHLATSYNSEAIVRILLENGADLDFKNKVGQTPYHLTKSPNVQKLLLKKQGELKSTSNSILNRDQTAQKQDIKGSEVQMKETADTVKSSDSKLFDDIISFDKTNSLKRSKTFDNSTSVLHSQELKLSLSIKSFDRSASLKHSKTFDRSHSLLRDMKHNHALQSFDSLSLRHVDLVDKGNPLHLYYLAQSCYKDYSDEISTNPEQEPAFDDNRSVSNEVTEAVESSTNPEQEPVFVDNSSVSNEVTEAVESSTNPEKEPALEDNHGESNGETETGGNSTYPEKEPASEDNNSLSNEVTVGHDHSTNPEKEPASEGFNSVSNKMTETGDSLTNPEKEPVSEDKNRKSNGVKETVESSTCDNSSNPEEEPASDDNNTVSNEVSETGDSATNDIRNPDDDVKFRENSLDDGSIIESAIEKSIDGFDTTVEVSSDKFVEINNISENGNNPNGADLVIKDSLIDNCKIVVPENTGANFVEGAVDIKGLDIET